MSSTAVSLRSLELGGDADHGGARHGARPLHTGAALQELIQVPQSSLQASWDSQHPRPDLRLLVIEPHDLGSATLAKLEEVGWGLCHVTVPPFLQSGTIPQYTLSYRWLAVVCHLVPSPSPQQAVRVEHDPVLRPALAGQRHAGGDQPAHAAGQGGQVNVIHSPGSNGHGSLCTGWSVHGTRGQVPE